MKFLCKLLCLIFGLVAVSPSEAALRAVAGNGSGGAASTTAITCTGTNDDVAIQAAINSASASGGGTVSIAAGTCTINTPVTLANNVSIVGVPTAFPTNTFLLNNGQSLSGGTILVAGTATQGFVWNPTDSGVAPGAPPGNGWGANQLSGVVIENLAFSGFTGSGIKIGAINKEGLVQSRLRHLGFYNCGTIGTGYETGLSYALELRNSGGINVSEIYISKSANGFLFRPAVAQITQQLGNSVFSDIQVDGTQLSSPSNFSRAVVIGSDPNVATSFNNEIRANAIAMYYFGGARTTVSDTATFTGGTTFTVATGTNFPVGMPVKFTASNGNIQSGFTYLVLSQSGNTLSVGNSRGASAISLPASGTLTIQQKGYPLLDLGGPSSTSGMPSSTFTGLDVEGDSSASIYVDNASPIYLQINQITNSGTSLVLRGSAASVFNTGSMIAPDQDGASGSSVFFGNIGKGIQFGHYPAGIFRDNTNNVDGFSLSNGGSPRLSTPQFFMKGNNGFVYPNIALGETINPDITGSTSIINFQDGLYGINCASACTQTLPALVNDSTLSSGSPGLRYRFISVGIGVVTINANSNTSGQWINNSSGAAITLNQGQYVDLTATLASNGTTTYWTAEGNGAVSGFAASAMIYSAVSGSLGGSALLAGACSSRTDTVTGATTSMVALADPNTYPGDGTYWDSTVTSANTVTTKVCAAVALTPTASTYNIRVIQ